jgi:hypothetical protein
MGEACLADCQQQNAKTPFRHQFKGQTSHKNPDRNQDLVGPGFIFSVAFIEHINSYKLCIDRHTAKARTAANSKN